MAIAIIVSAVIFVAGAAAGAIALVSLGIRREERDFTLTSRAPDHMSRGARVVTGLWVRQRTEVRRPAADRQDLFV